MIGGQIRVGSASGQTYAISRGVDNLLLGVVPSTDSTQVANIVRKGRNDEMQPVVWAYIPSKSKPTQNILGYQRH